MPKITHIHGYEIADEEARKTNEAIMTDVGRLTKKVNDFNLDGVVHAEDCSIDLCDIFTLYRYNTLIYVVKAKPKRVYVMPTNGDVSGPTYENHVSVKDYAIKNGIKIACNGGLNGRYMFDGVLNTSRLLNVPYYCAIDDGIRFMADFNGVATLDQISAFGKNVLPVFSPLIEAGNPFDISIITESGASDTILTKFNSALDANPRQILGYDEEGYYYIISATGREMGSVGLTYEETISVVQEMGLTSAAMLDGGGSTQTVIDGNNILPNIDDAEEMRKVYTAIIFEMEGE